MGGTQSHYTIFQMNEKKHLERILSGLFLFQTPDIKYRVPEVNMGQKGRDS